MRVNNCHQIFPSKVGPFEDGGFKTVKVSSIRRNKAACRLVRAQQSAALALDLPISQVPALMSIVDSLGELSLLVRTVVVEITQRQPVSFFCAPCSCSKKYLFPAASWDGSYISPGGTASSLPILPGSKPTKFIALYVRQQVRNHNFFSFNMLERTNVSRHPCLSFEVVHDVNFRQVSVFSSIPLRSFVGSALR